MEAIDAPLILVLLLFLFTSSIQATNNSKLDPYALLHIIRNPNGSITRPKHNFPTVHPNSSTLSLSKDVTINPYKHTWARIYLPTGSDPTQANKLPVLVFNHGGGFVILSAASSKFNTFCSEAASQLNALVVSVEYRLAPEHRLPAQYEDVLEALYWIKKRKDDWIRVYADISKCVIMGESAGGNIAYNLGLQASTLVNDLKPLVIKGLVLVQPFFGGVKPTGSELRLANDSVLPLVVNHLLWNLSLPSGSNRNHVYCNPITGSGSSRLSVVSDLGWRVRLVGCEGDPLFYRQVELVKLLERRGVSVKANFSKGGYHGVFSDKLAKAKVVFQLVKSVLSSGPLY